MNSSKRTKYTEEEREFFRKFIPGHSYKEIQEAFTEKFRPISWEQVRAYCKNNKIHTGLTGRFRKGFVPWNKGKHYQAGGRCKETQFKKGNKPKKWRPVGSERVNAQGYIEIKVKEPNVWMLKHRYVWQQYRGNLPEGSIVIFKDGDRQNTEISNLMLITRGVNARLTMLGLQDARGMGAMEAAVMTALMNEKISSKVKCR